MKTLHQFTEEYKGPINWVAPNAKEEHDEVHFQLNGHKENPFLPDWVHKRLSQLTDKNEWDRAVKRGKPENFSRQDVRNTNNTGDSWANSNSDARKRARAPTLYGPNKKVQRPIYLRNPETGETHLISGHHRSTYVTDVLHRPVSVHVIE